MADKHGRGGALLTKESHVDRVRFAAPVPPTRVTETSMRLVDVGDPQRHRDDFYG